ncbi:MAG TPA: division/cell wall cluster transcriptional repressor MraZ [Gammaproteobacteria bacterium]|nr:division/cell wall cluster transcriptional repressor MraZ [Gammaproteobacteria bacterium]
MFRGVNNLTLDAKGRLAVPARYRERLAAACEGQLVVTIDRGYYLLIYPLPVWEEIEAKLVTLPSLHPQVRELQRLLVGHATEVGMDSHGRVLLPAELREFAKLDREVVLLGLMNKFELWDKHTWDERREASLAGGSGSDGSLPEELARLAL